MHRHYMLEKDGRRSGGRRVWWAIAGLILASPVMGQEPGSCAAGWSGDFGIERLGCEGDECVIARILDGHREDGSEIFTWLYSTEPEVVAVRPGSPAAGILRVGDRIVAIDGLPITTREGSRRLQHAEPGDVATLAYRRVGQVMESEIRVGRACLDGTASAEPATLTGVRVPGSRRPGPDSREEDAAEEVLDMPAVGRPTTTATPGVYLGLTFECSICSVRTFGDEVVRYSFSQPVRILRVDPDGPAARAGLAGGDLIHEIDGHAIDSDEAGETFGHLQPGAPVRLGIRRFDGSVARVRLVPEARGPGAPASELPLRYTRAVRGVAVEVRGAPVTAQSDDGEGTITIYTDTNVIRIRVPVDGGN